MEQSKYEESILQDEAKRSRKNTWSLLVIISLLLLISAFLYYFFLWQPQQTAQPRPAIATPAESLYIPPVSTKEVAQENIVDAGQLDDFTEFEKQPQLITLDDSNDIAIATLGSLSAGDKWLQWVTTDEALRKFTVVIDNIAAGKVAHKYISIPKPAQKFTVVEKDQKEYFKTDSYARYNPYIEIFNAMDVDLIVSSYHQLSPLLEEAYAELGYPERRFDSVLLRAIDVLLDTPSLPDGEIELTHTSVVYKYADAELESLSPVQKQMLRMGPRNMATAKEKLQTLKAALIQ